MCTSRPKKKVTFKFWTREFDTLNHKHFCHFTLGSPHFFWKSDTVRRDLAWIFKGFFQYCAILLACSGWEWTKIWTRTDLKNSIYGRIVCVYQLPFTIPLSVGYYDISGYQLKSEIIVTPRISGKHLFFNRNSIATYINTTR